MKLNFLADQGFTTDEIHTVSRFLDQNAAPYYFKMTGTDQETGKSGYFISCVEPKMTRATKPMGYVILLTPDP